MNEAFVNLAREVFAAASRTGPSKLPEGTAHVVEYLDNEGELGPSIFESLGQQLAAQFPFLRHRSQIDEQCAETARAEWEAGVRAVLERLRCWSPSLHAAFSRLSTLLYTIDNLGLDSADIGQVASELGNDALTDGLYQLICESEVDSFLPRHDRIPNAEHELKRAAEQGNFLKIGYVLPHIMPEPKASLWSAVRLLWRIDPEKLAKAVAAKDSVFLSVLVRFTLTDDFPLFALRVPIVWLKYAGVDVIEKAFQRGSTAHNWEELLRQLLVQVADTSAWSGWMQALVSAPYDGSLICLALPKVLASLGEAQWTDFVRAVHLGYSKRAAKPVADIMTAFALQAGDTPARTMWSLCFGIWNNWNYGSSEQQSYLGAPVACALDYPVSMYYSKMPSHERDKIEAELALAVETIEQRWFTSSSELVTERNRLLSRLRLVAHGRGLANGITQLLPPAIQPCDAYSATRYGYFEV